LDGDHFPKRSGLGRSVEKPHNGSTVETLMEEPSHGAEVSVNKRRKIIRRNRVVRTIGFGPTFHRDTIGPGVVDGAATGLRAAKRKSGFR